MSYYDLSPSDRRELYKKNLLHGLELRGREHPEEVLPLLREVERNNDKTMRKMLVHIIGQISYKKACLERVADELKDWDDREFTLECVNAIIQVHKRYCTVPKPLEENIC